MAEAETVVSQTVTIIDYGSGNLRSAAKAFERATREVAGDAEILVTNDPEKVRRADRIVLPGVGAFADCRAGLDAVAGMVEVLEERVIRNGTPFLGICVGMQLMADEGREKAVTKGLGWIPGAVVRIEPKGDLKVPHMGWNTLTFGQKHPVLAGIPDGDAGLHAYFVHSYHLATARPETLVATADYGQTVTAIVGRDNMLGTQFHPEKSQTLGLTLIGNFLRWNP
jgi:imidazole glycerol-phosphate synthase subunit HisH